MVAIVSPNTQALMRLLNNAGPSVLLLILLTLASSGCSGSGEVRLVVRDPSAEPGKAAAEKPKPIVRARWDISAAHDRETLEIVELPEGTRCAILRLPRGGGIDCDFAASK